MSILMDTLEQLFSWFQQHRPEYASQLQSGLSEEEIDEKLETIPFKLPLEIHELYRWQNGSKLAGGASNLVNFFPHYVFLPLETAVRQYHELVEDLGEGDQWDEEFPETGSWKTHWFPIFFFDSQVYFASCSTELIATTPIWNYYSMYPGPELCYDSLTAMLQTLLECYQTGAYYLNEQGTLVEDEHKSAPILRKYNPGLTDLVLEQLEHQIWGESWQMINASLMRLKDSKILPQLIQMLQSPSARTVSSGEGIERRASIAKLLGEMGDARAVPSLIQLLQEEALTVRFSAVIALGQLKAREGVSDLIERLQDPEKEVQLLAAWALGEIGDPVAIEPLSQLAQAEEISEDLRTSVREAISKIEASN